MWLLGRRVPDFKTTADFRKDNATALQATCRAFVQFCRQVSSISGELVAIDGSKFQAVASPRKHVSLAKLKGQQAKLEARIARYLVELGEADREEEAEAVDRGAVQAALRQLESRHADNLTAQALMQAQGLDQFIVGEDEARLMRTLQGAKVACNVQSAVDGEHGLILPPSSNTRSAPLKQWILGNGRFLLRQLRGARTEMALAINAYDLKRAIKVLGARRLIELMG